MNSDNTELFCEKFLSALRFSSRLKTIAQAEGLSPEYVESYLRNHKKDISAIAKIHYQIHGKSALFIEDCIERLITYVSIAIISSIRNKTSLLEEMIHIVDGNIKTHEEGTMFVESYDTSLKEEKNLLSKYLNSI